MQEEEIQKAIFVGNYDGAVDTCLKAGRLADALLIANIGGAELFKKTMQRYMRRNPRPYMAVRVGVFVQGGEWHGTRYLWCTAIFVECMNVWELMRTRFDP